MTLVYLLVGAALALCCGSALQRRYPRVLYALVLATVVVPIFLDTSARNIVQAATMLFALGVQAVFAHADYAAVSDENLRGAAYISLKRVAGAFTKLVVAPAILGWAAAPWGMTALGVPVVAQGLLAFLILDFYLYAYHRAQHHFDFFWHFHKLHHATAEMTVFASGRAHLLDATLKQSTILVLAWAIGVSPEAFIYGYALPVLLLDGLEHANVDFPGKRLRWLAHIFVSPNGHALHHTPHNDRVNYAVGLAIWDKLFGTFELPERRPEVFGVEDRAWGRNGLWWQHLEPLRAIVPRMRARSRA